MSTDIINKNSNGLDWIIMKDSESIGCLHINTKGDEYKFEGNKEAFLRLIRRECTAVIAQDVIKDECLKHDLCSNCKSKSLCDNNDIPIPANWKLKEK